MVYGLCGFWFRVQNESLRAKDLPHREVLRTSEEVGSNVDVYGVWFMVRVLWFRVQI